MSSVRVVTDSTATLPAEVAAERGIVVVPLQVLLTKAPVAVFAMPSGYESVKAAPTMA